MIGSRQRKVVVKTYTSRRQMERGLNRMAERGYVVQEQSGHFGSPFAWRWNRRRVVLTFRLENEE